MRILFAPDFRRTNPYQDLLARALEEEGVEVDFLSDYKRVLPLSRGVRKRMPVDLVHLHWPEAYFSRRKYARLRALRYGLDLTLAQMQCPLVLTAHNLMPHYARGQGMAKFNFWLTHKFSPGVIAHSEGAAMRCAEVFGNARSHYPVIPHGDNAQPLWPPANREQARNALKLNNAHKHILIFGRMGAYKGIEEVVRCWRHVNKGYQLHLLGEFANEAFGKRIKETLQGIEHVHLHEGWVDDSKLREWLSAVDATLFNYVDILTSGAAVTARSFGLPVILPKRLDTIALDEPSPYVVRFEVIEEELENALNKATAHPVSPDTAVAFRRKCSWRTVAQAHKSFYQSVLRRPQV